MDEVKIEDPQPILSPESTSKTLLQEYFASVVEEKPLQVESEAIYDIVNNELEINVDNLNTELKDIVPYLFIYYFKNWPGWHKHGEFVEGILTMPEWFRRLKLYLYLKLKNVIKNSFNKALKEIEEQDQEEKVSEIAPFHVKLQGPPYLLNSLIFINVNNDAVIKRHSLISYRSINISHILNWPFIEVQFVSPQLSFTRRNIVNIERFLSRPNEKIQFPDTDFIEKAEILNPQGDRQVFSHEIIQKYINRYLNFLNSCRWSPYLLRNVSLVLNELLKDIVEIGLESTIASNTSVVFNIGGFKYSRCKAVQPEQGQGKMEVKYFEIITPRMEVTLKYFRPVSRRRSESSEIEFEFSGDVSSNHPGLRFGCMFCNLYVNMWEDLVVHLQQEHGQEQILNCLTCYTVHNVPNLAKDRWKHQCTRLPTQLLSFVM